MEAYWESNDNGIACGQVVISIPGQNESKVSIFGVM